MKRSRRLLIPCLLAATLIPPVTAHAESTGWNFGWESKGQGVWSGSDPQEFTVGTKPCDYKVRGRSGVWTDFKGEMPPGKIVIGVVNPREPDIIFFQLKKASPFLFAAKRTCFQGETPYVEDPVEAEKHKKLKYPLVFGSFWMIRDSDKVAADDVLSSVSNIGCLGGGYEWVNGYYRILTGACLGLGVFGSRSSKNGTVDDYKTRRLYHLPVYLEGYYDLPGTPYAAGLQFTTGFSLSRQTLASSGVTESATNFFWSLGMAWRFYYENFAFVPKFGIYDGFSAKYFELQIGYLFQ